MVDTNKPEEVKKPDYITELPPSYDAIPDHLVNKPFIDSLISLVNDQANMSNPVYSNRFYSKKLDDRALEEIYKTGLGNKIVRIISQTALKDGLVIEEDQDDYYREQLAIKILKCSEFMLAYGRGVLVLSNKGDKLEEPLKKTSEKTFVRAFSGNDITVPQIDRDFDSERFYKPVYYTIWGHAVHYSRVIDFCYIDPVQRELPEYKYGGMSLYQLVRDQLINDAIVERSAANIIQKSSSFFYKIKGLNDAVRGNKTGKIEEKFQEMERNRGIYGATLIDTEEDVLDVAQAVNNLDDLDQISLRRLAMVTGIPVPVLVGENVTGLNSTSEQEMTTFYEMIESFRERYLMSPINELFEKLGWDKPGLKNHWAILIKLYRTNRM